MRSPAFQLRPANSKGSGEAEVSGEFGEASRRVSGAALGSRRSSRALTLVVLVLGKTGDGHVPLLHDRLELRRQRLQDLLRLCEGDARLGSALLLSLLCDS